ncbi:C40 family peptidase [Thiomicrorhabdus sediminis]|uniref:C40 family peptidase n=1 Tax=Thiomicrorhabdus sediminis TaxID=2580412 RepID=UPI00143D2B3E|nr:NlpC/P60 family protein [Thiomicrorhabdus sediminis]
MSNALRHLWLLSLLVSLIGCSSTTERSESASFALQLKSTGIDLQDSQQVRNELLAQFDLWRGAPYQYGGTSLHGVDCSAYVQNTFANRLGLMLPRTTRTQIKFGVPVDKTQLEVGDVVFFKVSRNTLHNGIYLGKGKFMHASSSKGVTISYLSNPYWQKTYLHARRYFN